MKKELFFTWLLGSTLALDAQNVGINNPNPLFPLTFNANLGDKISLWTDGTPTHYGFGIQSSLLQIFSKTDLDNIGFGYGSSGSFVERVRIQNKGDLGMIVNGRILLTNGTVPLHNDYGAGIWLYKADNSGNLGFIGVQNNQNMGFYGGPVGWGFTYDAINSRVGIGTPNPNAPLAFASLFGKKITLYQAATGDIGFAVQGNLLQIYADNPNADIAFGYDQAGTMTERMRIKGNGNVGIGTNNPQYPLDINGKMRLSGALNVNGSDGAPGQVLVSSGSGGPATWSNPSPKPYGFTILPTQYTSLDGVLTTTEIAGLSNSTFNLNQQSTVVYTLTLPCYASGPTQIDSKGFVVVEILNSSSTRVSFASSQYYIHRATTITQTVSGIALNLPAGVYTIKARLARGGPPDGNVDTHASLIANEQGIQFIAQVIPN